MRSLVVVLLASLVACTSASPPPTAPEEPRPPAPASATPSDERPRHPAGEMQFEDPPAGAAIGAPCTDPKWCGKSGRVAVVYESRHTRYVDPPCAATSTSKGPASMEATQACLDGPRIFVSSVCVVCRVYSEQRLLGRIDDMTNEQLAVAQKLGGLPASPLLTTAPAWSAAIAAAAKGARGG